MANPKRIGMRAWKREINDMLRTLSETREQLGKLLELSEQRPFPLMLAITYIGYALRNVGRVIESIRYLEQIADEDPTVEWIEE